MRIERVITVCDLPHDDETHGDKARFVIAERIYTVEACAEHKAEPRDAVRLVECSALARTASHDRGGFYVPLVKNPPRSWGISAYEQDQTHMVRNIDAAYCSPP